MRRRACYLGMQLALSEIANRWDGTHAQLFTKGKSMFACITKRLLTALCFTVVIGPASAAIACHQEIAQLKREFDARVDQVKCAYRAEQSALLLAHKALLAELRCARKQANALCGPEKKAAVRAIHCSRRDAVKRYECTVRELKQARRTELKALDAEFRLARQVAAVRVPWTDAFRFPAGCRNLAYRRAGGHRTVSRAGVDCPAAAQIGRLRLRAELPGEFVSACNDPIQWTVRLAPLRFHFLYGVRGLGAG